MVVVKLLGLGYGELVEVLICELLLLERGRLHEDAYGRLDGQINDGTLVLKHYFLNY